MKHEHLLNHYIICGAGKLGKVVIGELSTNEPNYIVIEKNKKTYS